MRDELVERLRAFDYNVDIPTFYDTDPECVSEAAAQIEADGRRIAALEVGISCQEILDNCDQHKRIEELTGITRQLKADNKRLREALIHTAGICNPVSGFLKNTTGLRKKHVENVQAIALAALGGKHD